MSGRSSATAVIAALALVAVPASARTVRDTQLWADFYLGTPVVPGVLVSGELIQRTVDDVSRDGQIETRLEFGHRFSRTLTGWVGWVHFTTYAAAGRNGIENDAVEQLNWTPGRIGPFALALRTRLDQRAIRGVGETSWRVREQARFVLPLQRAGPSLVLWAEPFLSLSRTRAQPYLLERMRSFVGINLPVARHMDLEAGYLNEYIPRLTGKRDNHVLSVVASVRL